MSTTGDPLFIGASISKSVLLIFNSLGNFLVIQAILKTKRLRTASNYLVVNLAICDLLSPLLNIPVDISVESVGGIWHYGSVLCKLIWPTATLFTTSSTLTLVAISIDRSRALRHPFVSKLSGSQALALIALLHTLSLTVILPYCMASVIKDGECTEDWTSTPFTPAGYTLILFHVQYAVPLVILAAVYTKAARYLRQCTSDLAELKAKGELPQTQAVLRRCSGRKSLQSLPKHLHHSESTRTVRIRGEQNARVVKMFAVVVAVFAVLTLPNNIHWLLKSFSDYGGYKHERLVSFLCVMCTYINCLANPIIYTRLSRDYKNYFLKFFRSLERCKCCHEKHMHRASTTRSLSTRTGKSSLKEFNAKTSLKGPTFV